MKKEQKDTNSLDKYFIIILNQITFSEDFILSREKISQYMIKNKICGDRLVSDILDSMQTKGYLIRKKLKGKKTLGYTINEEIISSVNESYTTVGVTKKGLPIYDKMTQQELMREFKGFMRRYRNNIANKKSAIHESFESFFITHTMFLTICLSWISRLNLSIYGGIFMNAEKKIYLAQSNIELLGEFIRILLQNMKEKNPDGYEMFLTSMHHYFEFLDPFENTPYSRQSKEASSLID